MTTSRSQDRFGPDWTRRNTGNDTAPVPPCPPASHPPPPFAPPASTSAITHNHHQSQNPSNIRPQPPLAPIQPASLRTGADRTTNSVVKRPPHIQPPPPPPPTFHSRSAASGIEQSKPSSPVNDVAMEATSNEMVVQPPTTHPPATMEEGELSDDDPLEFVGGKVGTGPWLIRESRRLEVERIHLPDGRKKNVMTDWTISSIMHRNLVNLFRGPSSLGRIAVEVREKPLPPGDIPTVGSEVIYLAKNRRSEFAGR